jgi:hypothetical protein
MRLVIKQKGSNPQVEPVGTPQQVSISGPISGAGLKTRNTAGLENEEEIMSECDCACDMCHSGEHHPDYDLEYHDHDDEFMDVSDEEPMEIIPLTNKITLVITEKKKKKGDRCVRIAKRKYNKWPSAYASGAVVKCRQGKIWKNLKEAIEQTLEELINEEGLKDWFGHNKGKFGGGWVNCRTGGPCGREKAGRGARQKYPACRPTMAQCKPGAVKRKKTGKRISWKDQRKSKK